MLNGVNYALLFVNNLYIRIYPSPSCCMCLNTWMCDVCFRLLYPPLFASALVIVRRSGLTCVSSTKLASGLSTFRGIAPNVLLHHPNQFSLLYAFINWKFRVKIWWNSEKQKKTYWRKNLFIFEIIFPINSPIISSIMECFVFCCRINFSTFVSEIILIYPKRSV